MVKLTSMGDLLHLMPALTDLQQHEPTLSIDWMAEDSFAELPLWHSSVNRVVPVSTRAWRSLKWQNITQFFTFLKDLRSQQYDIVVDAQGLIKSAVLARFARLKKGGQRIGYSADSIKESPAAWFYSKKIKVQRELHAIARLRQLFSVGFNYPNSEKAPDYNLQPPTVDCAYLDNKSILLFHSTTWSSKHIPESLWLEVIVLAAKDGYQSRLCWGNPAEKQRADRIANASTSASVLPKLSLTELAQEMQNAAGVIAVDTGLGHMAAGLGVPAVSIYGSTDSKLTGAIGENQVQLQSQYECSPCFLRECAKLSEETSEIPCYLTLSAVNIWQQLLNNINR